MSPTIVPDTHVAELKIRAEDGFELAATLHGCQSPRGAVIISSGTGIRRQFYRHLAAFLAQQGYLTLTYDYRGIGDSRPRRLRGFAADMSTWARLDMSAAIQHMRTLGLPLYWLGHSSGGQTVGLAQGAEQLQAVITVASGAGTWWKAPTASMRWMFAALLYGYVPVSNALFGYSAANRIGQGQDLPAGVASELARWCRTERYFADHLPPAELDRLARLDLPWLALAFSDDKLIAPEAMDRLLGLYPSCRVERRVLSPEQIGQLEIGHHGFFEPRRCGLLWPQLVEFFERAALAA